MDIDQFNKQVVVLNGITYGYVDQKPASTKQRAKGTIVLVHGWPDSWIGFRHQIPFLTQLGYRVLVVSQIGFGEGTDCPSDLKHYTWRSVCSALDALLLHCKVRRAVFVGHDWGGMVVYRMANYYPKRVKGLVVVSTPYFPPSRPDTPYISLEKWIQVQPRFRYQAYLADENVIGKDWSTLEDTRKLFKAIFLPGRGMKTDFEALAKTQDQDVPYGTMISKEEVEFYARQYSKDGGKVMKASTNWYRTRRLNYENDCQDFKSGDEIINTPTLFIGTNLDPILQPHLSRGMERFFKKMTRKSVESGHWGLIEKREEVNSMIEDFLQRLEIEELKHRI